MTHHLKRLLAVFMTAVMLLSALPMTAFAVVLNNDPGYNREILAELEQLCGSEEEAQAYYALLQQYGLLDEDGRAPESWDIRLNGEPVTLEELRTMLDNPDCDLEQYLWVDGSPISLGDLQTVLQIEDYIAYLRETYFSGHQWTQEQLSNLDSLVNQINTKGIRISGERSANAWPSGVSHEAQVNITQSGSTFTASLTGAAEGQTITFDWQALSGNQTVSGSGKITMTAGADGTASQDFSVTLDRVSALDTSDPMVTTGDLVYFVKLSNLENALFSNGKTAQTVQCIPSNSETLATVPDGSFTLNGTTTVETTHDTTWGDQTNSIPATVPMTSTQKYWIAWGVSDTMTVGTTYDTSEGNLLKVINGSITSAGKPADGTVVEPYHIEISAVSNGKTLASAVYKKDVNQDERWEYSADEAHKTNASFSLGEIGTEIQLASHSFYQQCTYYQNDGWMTTKSATDIPVTIKLAFTNTRSPKVTSITAPEGTYCPGQIVPVTVTFSKLVNVSSAKMKFNGESKEYKALSSGASNKVVFAYEVKDIDNTGLSVSSITATDTAGHTLTGYNPGGDTGTGQELNGVTLQTPNKADAVTGMSAEITDALTEPKLVVTVNISGDEDLTQWMGADFTANGDGTFTSNSLQIRYNGNEYGLCSTSETVTGQALTAAIPLALNTGEAAADHVAELILDDKLVMGRYASASQPSAVFITRDDIALTVNVKGSDGQDYVYADDTNTIYAQDSPVITAGYTLTSGKAYSFTGTEQLVWSSSDETVAKIDPDGKITPTGKAGQVYFILTAKNGGVEGKEVQVQTSPLKFGVGLTPFLLIPNNEIESVAGQPVTIYWSSNLCDKNGEAETAFTVTVTRDNSAGPEDTWTTTVTGTAASPAASAAIPAGFLSFQYSGEEGNNTFHVTVSASYQGKTYEATATVSLDSKPAVVRLNGLQSYYITDTAGAVNIGWSIENFDRFSSDEDLFSLQITSAQDANSVTVREPGAETAAGSGAYTGSYQFPIPGITASSGDPTSYRNVYTVTIQAKNGSDSTWSYDSFLLYVYDADALKIWTGGEDKSSVTLSNSDLISQMDQDQILALKRDIGLKEIISANYGEYAWSELADQIKWKSSDNGVASVNYQQGTLYENIENFDYVSYRPTTELGLSGLSDGRAIITATHSLTGMQDTLTVDVETLKNRLYLFQCYPQRTTTLTYTNGDGLKKEITSASDGAAAIYEPSGIQGDVYCSSRGEDGVLYLGTFYNQNLKSGEGNWTKLERYPCNNLTLRRAAYAYLYLKKPDGTPYTGPVTFRGGVYINDEYQKEIKFSLGSSTASHPGYQDLTAELGADGKLEVAMDQSQLNVSPTDRVFYVFEIAQGSGQTEYYPLFVSINASINQDAFVSSGEAVVNFRKNTVPGEHPFIAAQIAQYGSGNISSVLENTGSVGPSDIYPTAKLHTMVMWWGEDLADVENASLGLFTMDGVPVASGQGKHTISQDTYPFASTAVTNYVVTLDQDSLTGVVSGGDQAGLYLEYYKDGSTLSRRESLSLKLTNMIGIQKAEDSPELLAEIQKIGRNMETSAESGRQMSFDDQFVKLALNLAASDSYSTGDDKLLSLQLAPTSDPTKFLGFVELNLGNMSDEDQVTGVYANDDNSGKADLDPTPGLSELLVLAGKKSVYSYLGDDFNKVLKRKAVKDISFDMGGYLETLIYYDYHAKEWCMEILSGGFNAGGGVSFTWNWNTMVGPVPFTASLSIGGTAEVSMDALSAAYQRTDGLSGLGNDYLTQLRIYLYLRFFAGVGIDYAIIAFKLGIYGQIDVDMRFQWLNRPYLDNGKPIHDLGGEPKMDGQNFRINGQIGLEFVVKLLFIRYEKILYSYNFKLMNTSTGAWESIQDVWEYDQKAYNEAISGMLKNGSLSMSSVGGQQVMALNLAPTLEDNSYLDEGSLWLDGGSSFFSLDRENGMSALNVNSYEYADPILTDDGQIVAFLGIPGAFSGEDISGQPVAAMFAKKNTSAYAQPNTIGSHSGYGDSQLSLAGTASFAVSAWTRQMVELNKEPGAVLTNEDQMMMLNGTEIYAAVYSGGDWTVQRITENSGADMAPVVATNGSRAIVAWRSVASSGTELIENTGMDMTNFDQKDVILYKIYQNGGWGDTQTLYNGTSGNVKAIVADMLADGTAAVAYTLDTDSDSSTYTDREIVYAVVGSTGETRTVQATKDSYLDENPQLTTVEFDGTERFVLGWYTEQIAMSDGAMSLDGEGGPSGSNAGAAVSDIRLLDFDASGNCTQQMPDSITQAADAYDVSISPSFRFTKNSDTIDDLSILWVERAAMVEDGNDVERDILKGVKFYTYGQNSEKISFTGAIDVAEMGNATLIDHFDAYVSDAAKHEIKAVIMGTTYGMEGTQTRTGRTAGGETVSYQVPSASTSMYTAAEAYQDKIDVPAFLPDYDAVKLGANTQIWFSVDNRGIYPITKLEIKVGDETTIYDNLNLLPGGTLPLYGDYTVPTDHVIDPEFTVTATFAGGDTAEFKGKIYLNLPDVEVTGAKIVSEENGNRVIMVTLNNRADAALGVASDTKVRLGFYSDAACTTPIDGKYFDGGTEGSYYTLAIDNQNDLSMVNKGGYSKQVIFKAGTYVGEGQELPKSGLPVYIKAEVINNNGDTQAEPNLYNNTGEVACENLKVRTGEDVTITSNFSTDHAGSEVTVQLQNNRLTETRSGNIIVTLLDAEGNVLEEKQSYDKNAENNGFIILNGEEKNTIDFTFDRAGASIRVSYSDVVLTDNANAKIAELTLSGMPLAYREDAKTWYIPEAYAKQAETLLTIIPVDLRATIAVNGTPYSKTVQQSLTDLRQGLTIVVTAADGTTTATYYVKIQNETPPVEPENPVSPGGTGGGGGSSSTSTYAVAVTKPEHGKVTASPFSASSGSTVTLTVTPDSGYVLDTLTVTDNRGRQIQLTAQGGGKYTFTMPGGTVSVKAVFAPLPRDVTKPCDGGADCPSRTFTDLGGVGTWYHEAVDYALRNNLMGGYGSGLFGPNDNLTRAQLAQILYHREGRPAITGSSRFIDVSSGTWYSDAVNWAEANGIVSGYGGGLFGPNDSITREQLAVMLWRCSKSPAAANKELHFSDVNEISSYALNAVRWAVENGILNGYGDGRLGPKGLATRAQVAQMLKNFIENQEEKST